MAYSDKYILKFGSKRGVTGIIKIQKDEYVGDPIQLTLLENGLTIDYKFSGWFKPIVGQTCSLSILNDASNWYAYEDLMSLDEREFKIIIDASDANGNQVRLFDGWINSDIVESRYLHNSTFRITGSNYLTKIDDVWSPILTNIEKRSLIDILNDSLKLTGKDSSIYVLNRLGPSTSMADNQTLFNIAGVDTEVFWTNNVEKLSSLKTIEKILTPFDSYLYWWNGNWYIQRYADVWRQDGYMSYVAYSGDISYGYNDTGTLINLYEPSSSFSSKIITDQSQSISMIPGLNKLEVKLKGEEYLNLTINDFAGIQETSANYLVSPGLSNYFASIPALRGWNYFAEDRIHHFPGYAAGITPSEGYGFPPSDASSAKGIIGSSFGNISNAIYRYGVPMNDVGYTYKLTRQSISTQFKVTVDDKTIFNISWKFAPQIVIDASTTPKDWDYKLYYAVKYLNHDACIYDCWLTNQEHDITGGHQNPVWHLHYGNGDLENLCTTEVAGSELDDVDYSTEVNVSVQVGEAQDFQGERGDKLFQFIIIGEDIKLGANGTSKGETSYRDSHDYYPLAAYYGDIVISATGVSQDNLIVGQLSNKVLNSERVTIDMFDIQSLIYRNGLFTDPSFNTRTNGWYHYEDGPYSIPEWLIKDKMSLYNKNRRGFSASMKHAGFLKPFSMWYDDDDPSTRLYVLTSYTYTPTKDEYNCEFHEWSNDSINLI